MTGTLKAAAVRANATALFTTICRGMDSTPNPRPAWKSTSKIMHSSGFSKTSVALIAFLLEFVTSPKGPIVQVTSRLRFLQKAAGIENSVVRLEPQMPIRLPPNFRTGPVSNESGAAAIGSANEKAGYGIHTVVDVFPPLNDPVE